MLSPDLLFLVQAVVVAVEVDMVAVTGATVIEMVELIDISTAETVRVLTERISR